MNIIYFILEFLIIMQKPNFKITLLGLPNSGKTTFLKRLIKNTNEIEYNDYIPTLGVDVSEFDINDIRLNIWDCAGDQRYRGLKSGYHIDTKAAIIFRKNNDNSYLEYLNELPENIPVIYIDDYNVNNPSYSVIYYKNILYNLIINNV